MASHDTGATPYDSTFAGFDSPLMEQFRRDAYGEDIGQHSWVSADELRADIARLSLDPASQLLDVGCGPCGPLVFIVRASGCRAAGVDLSAPALASGMGRALAAGVADRIELIEADANSSLPFESGRFDVVISLDAVLHVSDRARFFSEVARVLAPRGKFLLTDAAVVTGSVSSRELQQRSAFGVTYFVPSGFNELALATAGLTLVDVEDRTGSVLRNATGRLRAMAAHRLALEAAEVVEALRLQEQYLTTVVAVSERKALSRFMYVAERERD
jgi:cyclopropane fatty-acyl-phospholipid synthase-like methyltransferase